MTFFPPQAANHSKASIVLMDFFLDYLWEGKEKSFPLTAQQQDQTTNDFINITPKEVTTKEILSTVKSIYQKNNFSLEKIEQEKEKILEEYYKKQKKQTEQEKDSETKLISTSVSGWKIPTEFLKEEKIEPHGVLEMERDERELKVLDYYPKDKVFQRPNFISIIFNKKITKEDLQEGFIETKPKIKGTIKVVGNTSIFFEPTNEISMATEYEVKVKKNEKEIFSFKFTTSPPRIIDYLPGSLTVSSQPIFYLEFDQEINQEEIIKQLRLLDGSILSLRWTSYPLKLLDVDKAKNLIESRYRLKKNSNSYETSLLALYEKRFREALGGRFIWFTIDNSTQLPLGYRYYLKLLPGTPGAEKDSTIKTSIEQGFKFKTHDKLFIESFEPNENLHCHPGQKWIIRFSNAISEDVDLHSCVKITPELKALKISLFENYVSISGRTNPNTKYSVQFNSNLEDVFSEKYMEKKVITFKTQEVENQFLSSFQSGVIVMNPDNNSLNYHVITLNVEKFNCIILKIKNPKEAFHISPFGSKFKNEKEKDVLSYLSPIGDIVFNGNIQTFGKWNQLKETKIDLKEILKTDKIGHFFVHIHIPNSSNNQKISSWVQFTDISIDCIDTPSNDLNCWINRLSDGNAIENATVNINDEESNKKTDKDGLVILETNQQHERDILIVAEYENDISFLKISRKDKSDSNLLLFSSKTVFKPNEPVHIFGLVKGHKKVSEIKYEIKSEEMNKIIKTGVMKVDEQNTFEFMESLPRINTGKMIFKFDKTEHEIFIIPESQQCEDVILKLKTKNHILKQFALVSAEIEHRTKFHDGKTFEWIINQKRITSFIPGNWKLFKFNTIDDITKNEHEEEQTEAEKSQVEMTEMKKFEGTINSNGKHELSLFFNENYQKRKECAVVQVSIKGRLKEAFRFTPSKNELVFLVHPCNLYVGLKTKKKVFKLNVSEPISIEFIVCDVNGASIADVLVHFTIYLKKQKFDLEKRKMIFIDQEVKNLKKKSTEGVSKLDLTDIQKGGIYHVNAMITDNKTNLSNQSSIYFLVEKNEEVEEDKLIKKENDIILISDKRNYFENDTSQIFLQNRFNSPANLFLVSLREKVFSRQIFKLKNNYQMIKLKMETDYNPNVFIFALIVGKFSNFSTGQLKLNIFKKLEGQVTKEDENDVFKKELIFNTHQLFKKDLNISLDFNVSKSQDFTHEFNIEIKQDSIVKNNKNGYVYLLLTEDDLHLNFALRKSTIEDEIQNYSNRNFIYIEEDWKKIYDEFLLNEEEKEDTSEDFEFGHTIDEISENFDLIHEDDLQEDHSFKKEIQLKKFKNCFTISKKLNDIPLDKSIKIELNLPKNLQDFHVLIISQQEEKFGIEKFHFLNSFPLEVQIECPHGPLFVNEICHIQVRIKKKKNFKHDIVASYLIKDDDGSGEISFLNVDLRKQTLKFNDKEILLEVPIKCVKEGKKKIDFVLTIDEKSMKSFNPNENSKTIQSIEIEIVQFAVTKVSKISRHQQFGEEEDFTERVVISKKFFQEDTLSQLKFSISESVFPVLQYLISRLLDENSNILFDTTSTLLGLNLVSNSTMDDSNVFNDYSKLNLTSIQMKSTIQNCLQEITSKKVFSEIGQGEDVKLGWNLFGKESTNDLYLNLYIIHAILISDLNGYIVQESVMNIVKNFLEKFEEILEKKVTNLKIKNTLKAYYYYVHLILNENQSIILTKAKSLYSELNLNENMENLANISLEGVCWLMMVLHLISSTSYLEKEIGIMKKILYRNFEFAHKNKMTDEEKHDLFYTNLKTKAILLNGLVLIDPENEQELNEIFGNLMSHIDGITNSFEISFLISALKSYQNIIEVDDSLLKSINVWLNADLFIEDTSFNSSKIANFKSTNLKKNEENVISIKKFGKGFSFFTIEMLLTNQLQLQEFEEKKIFIEKTFEKLNSLKLTKKNEKYIIKRGELIKVRIIVMNSNDSKNILIRDWIPNGFNFISFETILKSEDEKKDLKNHFNTNKIDHQESIENRISLYIENLTSGSHEYSYILQANFQGEFFIPSCQIENLFDHSTRTKSQTSKSKFEILPSPILKNKL